MSRNPMVIYIVCRGHSGSTLLELMLNRSNNVAAMGELDLLPLQLIRDGSTRWVGTCSCQERPQRCPVWGPIIAEIVQRFAPEFVNRPFSWRLSNTGLDEEFGWKAPGARLRYIFHRIVRELTSGKETIFTKFLTRQYRIWAYRRDFIAQEYAALKGVEAVVDSSKDPQQMLDQLTYSKLTSRVIYLTRDPRGVAWSAVKSGKGTVETETKDWAKLNGRILKLLKRADPDSWIHVSYETLCSEPEVELERIHQFLGIKRDEIDFKGEFDKRHTIAGNKLRFQQIQGINEDKVWKDNLTKEDLATIKLYSRSIADELGYQL